MNLFYFWNTLAGIIQCGIIFLISRYDPSLSVQKHAFQVTLVSFKVIACEEKQRNEVWICQTDQSLE